jgi:hypothetical protein
MIFKDNLGMGSSMFMLYIFLLVHHLCVVGVRAAESHGLRAHGHEIVSEQTRHQTQAQPHRQLDTQLQGTFYYNEMYYSDTQCSQLLFTRSVLANSCYYSSSSNTVSTATFDYVVNTVTSIGSTGYLLTQNYFADDKCATVDRGRPTTMSPSTPTQCQATAASGATPYLYVTGSVSASPVSPSNGGITVKGFGASDCSGNPTEVSYFTGNAAGTFLNNAATACVGMYSGLCGVGSAGISFYSYNYPFSSGTCTGTPVGKYTYGKTCTAKGYMGLGE